MKTQTLLLSYDHAYGRWFLNSNRKFRFCQEPMQMRFGIVPALGEQGQLEMIVGTRKRKKARRVRVRITWFHDGVRYRPQGATYTIGKNAFWVRVPSCDLFADVGDWLIANVPMAPPEPGPQKKHSFINLYVSVKRKEKS